MSGVKAKLRLSGSPSLLSWIKPVIHRMVGGCGGTPQKVARQIRRTLVQWMNTERHITPRDLCVVGSVIWRLQRSLFPCGSPTRTVPADRRAKMNKKGEKKDDKKEEEKNEERRDWTREWLERRPQTERDGGCGE